MLDLDVCVASALHFSKTNGQARVNPNFCGLLLAQVVGVDATSAQSVLTVLAQNSTAAFADYAQSIVVAVAEAQSTNVSTAVADVIGSETPGNMSEVCAHLDRLPSSNQSFGCCETFSCPLN